jgi:hypothetical protein
LRLAGRESKPIAPGRFGGIHGLVSTRHQGFGSVAIVRVSANANTEPHFQLLPSIQWARRMHAVEQFLRNGAQRPPRWAGLSSNTTGTRRLPMRATVSTLRVADRPGARPAIWSTASPPSWPQRSLMRFEVVDVDEQQGEVAPRCAVRTGQRLLQTAPENARRLGSPVKASCRARCAPSPALAALPVRSSLLANLDPACG